jgi:hypothetical protein
MAEIDSIAPLSLETTLQLLNNTSPRLFLTRISGRPQYRNSWRRYCLSGFICKLRKSIKKEELYDK